MSSSFLMWHVTFTTQLCMNKNDADILIFMADNWVLSSSYLIKPRCKGYGCESDIPHVFNPKTVLKKNSKSLKKPDISSLEKKWFWTWQRAFITFLILPQYKTFVTCNKGNYVLNIKIRNHNINLNNIKKF